MGAELGGKEGWWEWGHLPRKGNSDGHVKGNMSGITRLEKRGGRRGRVAGDEARKEGEIL